MCIRDSEYVLTTAYDISTATLNNTKTVHVVATHGGGDKLIPTQVVFNNDGTKMFILTMLLMI